MSEVVVPVRNYLLIWAALMLLLIATVAFDFVSLGWGNTLIALGIAVAKALLVAAYFMHLRYSSRLTWIFASAGVFWLGILITLAMSDYLTRP